MCFAAYLWDRGFSFSIKDSNFVTLVEMRFYLDKFWKNLPFRWKTKTAIHPKRRTRGKIVKKASSKKNCTVITLFCINLKEIIKGIFQSINIFLCLAKRFPKIYLFLQPLKWPNSNRAESPLSLRKESDGVGMLCHVLIV